MRVRSAERTWGLIELLIFTKERHGVNFRTEVSLKNHSLTTWEKILRMGGFEKNTDTYEVLLSSVV